MNTAPFQSRTKRLRNAFFTVRIVIYWLCTIGALVGGVYCVYRAVLPMIALYGNALNDPLGEWSEKFSANDLKAEVWRWAIPGAIALVFASIFGWLASVSWKRLLMATGVTAETPIARPPARKANCGT